MSCSDVGPRRAQFSAALNTIDAERTAQMSHAALLHPAAAKVLATLDREWDGLARHREFPELALDNNTSERALRGPVVGRKNYYGSGSVVSAQLASRVFTITATADPGRAQPTGLPACLPRRMRPGRGHRPHRAGADPVPALGDEHPGPHRLGSRPQTPTRHHRARNPGRSTRRAGTRKPARPGQWSGPRTAPPARLTRSGHPPADDHRRAHGAARALTRRIPAGQLGRRDHRMLTILLGTAPAVSPGWRAAADMGYSARQTDEPDLGDGARLRLPIRLTAPTPTSGMGRTWVCTRKRQPILLRLQ